MANYTGDDSLITARAAAVIDLPEDADPQVAETYKVAFRKLADFADYLQTYAGLLNTASTWTQTQTFNGTAGSDEPGLVSIGATPNGHGAYLKPTGTGWGAYIESGNIKMDGSNPAKNAAYANTVTPSNICKAWACIVCNAGSYTFEGFNVLSVVSSGTDGIKVTLAQGVAATTSAAVLAIMAAGTVFISSGFTSTTEIAVTAWKHDGTAHDLQTGTHRVNVAVFGYQ